MPIVFARALLEDIAHDDRNRPELSLPPLEATSSTLLIALHESADPRDVARGLGVIPWQSWRSGESIDGQGASVLAESGFKIRPPASIEYASVHDQVAYWLSFLAEKSAGISELGSHGWRFILDCYLVSPDEMVLDPRGAAILAQLAVDLQFSADLVP